MNNLLTYFGLVDARISASDKDLPVIKVYFVHKSAIRNDINLHMPDFYQKSLI